MDPRDVLVGPRLGRQRRGSLVRCDARRRRTPLDEHPRQRIDQCALARLADERLAQHLDRAIALSVVLVEPGRCTDHVRPRRIDRACLCERLARLDDLARLEMLEHP